MKILTYAQEFIIFRDMESDDNDLMRDLNTFGEQREKYQDNLFKVNGQLKQNQVVLDQLRKKHDDEKKILKQFVYPED